MGAANHLAELEEAHFLKETLKLGSVYIRTNAQTEQPEVAERNIINIKT